MSANKTVGEYLLDELKNLQIKRVYGIPGDYIIKFFKLLEDDPQIELCTFCHEQGVGFAAVADARATRKPAVAVVTYGPGILNVLNAVACAYAEKTPLILVAGGPHLSARGNDFFMHHTVKNCGSLLNAVSQVTAQAVLIDNPQTAGEKIAKALAVCQDSSLPVYIELPADMVNQKITLPKKPAVPLQASKSSLKTATNLIVHNIAQVQKPVIMAGVESDRFDLKQQILKFAKKINVPVVSTMLARDHMPNDASNFYGVYLGVAGNKVADKLVAQSDFVLVLGEMLSDVNLGAKLTSSKRGKIVWCFSGEVNIDGKTFADVPLKDLVEMLSQVELEKKSEALPKKEPPKINSACRLDNTPLVMGKVIDAVNWLFSKYGQMPLIADTGDCMFASLNIDASNVLAPCFYGTMGFAVPAAIGYALATKNRPLVLVGDGGFQMTGQEICNCPRYKINPIFVVINNRRWGMEQLFYPSAKFNELVNWDYTEMARLWGGKGYRVADCKQLYRALEDAYAQSVFTLIEVVTERDELSDELMAWIKEQKGE
jgi:indolepyruvate decarboxylase